MDTSTEIERVSTAFLETIRTAAKQFTTALRHAAKKELIAAIANQPLFQPEAGEAPRNGATKSKRRGGRPSPMDDAPILAQLQNGPVSSRRIADTLRVDRLVVSSKLHSLRERGLIRMEGEKRNAVWMLADEKKK